MQAANPAMSLVNVVRLLRLPHTRAEDPDLVTRVAMLMDHLEDISATPALAEMWRTTAVLPLTRDLPASPYSEVATIYTIYYYIYIIYCYIYLHLLPYLHYSYISVLSEADVLHAVGVLQTNTVSLAAPGQRHGLYTALYPTFSFLSHSCVCNAKFNVARDRSLQLTAQTAIRAGEEITIQYMSPLLGNTQRRAKIKWAHKWFISTSYIVTSAGRTGISSARVSGVSTRGSWARV